MQNSRLTFLALLLIIVMAACQPAAATSEVEPIQSNTNPPTSLTTPPAAQTGTPAASARPTDLWQILLQHTPVPWTTPLPPVMATVLDATYVKINPRLATPFPCARCPDYGLEGGVWKFQFDKGIFRIYHALSTWRSLGSYTVAGDQLYLFNDPYCNRETGVYSWKLEDGILILKELNDPCSQGLRAANLVDQPWHSCRPPNPEAMVTDHWQKPEGCDPG